MRTLAALHILILALSNVLVQYPFTLFGWHTTWGAFSYPLIFIISDLSVRLEGPKLARRTVMFAMLPGLLISYGLATLFAEGFLFRNLLLWNALAFRVAFASFCAYVLGQLLDIAVFQRLRHYSSWWVAPTISSVVGNILDTWCFFFLAFYYSGNAFLAQHWPEIAVVDLMFKLLISILSFIPIYGLLLKWLCSKNSFHFSREVFS